MKKVLVTVAAIIIFFLRSMADEGMWLPMLLGQQVYNDMVKKGLKLTKEQLYSINKASMKDGIVIFGGGCTASVVSAEGLIFTNYHCGYDVITEASKTGGSYLQDGFYAVTKNDEIPAQGLSVQFLLRVEDVTAEVQDSLNGLSSYDRMQRQQSVLASINKRFSDPSKFIEARTNVLFKGNQFLVFIYQRYKDIRLVGAPPESIGLFGRDADNWEWPQYKGNFIIFRVYANKDGSAAEYSEENIPMKPKWFFPLSIKGYKEGDFTLVYGYPGNTNRYESSYGVKLKTEIENPAIVNLRDMRLKYMLAEMKKDSKTKLKLASYYASIANYWKFFEGETKQLLKGDVYGQRKKAEEAFISWAKGKKEYENIFSDWEKAYNLWKPYSKHTVYLREGIMASPLIYFASSLQQVENTLVSGRATTADMKKAIENADKWRKSFLEEEDKPSDQNILAAVTKLFYEDIPQDQHPIGLYYNIKNQYGDLKDEATYRKFAKDVFNKTMIFDDKKWNAFIAKPDAVVLQDDPAFAFASAFSKNFNGKYLPYSQQFMAKNNDFARLYIKGIMEKDTVKAKLMYPDAAFNMRINTGNVKSYKPSASVSYDCVTTAAGLLEKYVAGDYEYDLPAKQVDLLKKKDFGIYADKIKKTLLINFITTNDITGGSSGSPILNANGEMMGLAYDLNYEGLGHKIAFDKNLNRTVCVDIRYVLWCIDKLGGAASIMKEFKIIK